MEGSLTSVGQRNPYQSNREGVLLEKRRRASTFEASTDVVQHRVPKNRVGG